jgi:hypothetical protein
VGQQGSVRKGDVRSDAVKLAVGLSRNLRRRRAGVSPRGRSESGIARSKLEHAVLLFLRYNGPLGFHWGPLHDIAI